MNKKTEKLAQNVALSDALVANVDYFRGSILSAIDNIRKMYKRKRDPLERAKIIHKEIDRCVKSEAERNKVKIVCTKGCSGCCTYMNVMATRDEIALIKSFLNGKLPKDQKDHCPFLKDNACSIHPVRPGACRKLVAISFPCKERFVSFPAEIIWSAAVTVNGGTLIHKANNA